MSKKPIKQSSEPYEVGYRRPPKKFYFQKGRSGNPTGERKQRPSSLAADLRSRLQEELNKKMRLHPGEQKHAITKAAAGIERLVDQFAEGDHRARRDLIGIAERLGIDLTAGRERAIGNAVMAALTKEDQAIITDFLRRHGAPEPRKAEFDAGGDQTRSETSTTIVRIHFDDFV